jgi:RHH-type proline utilization regulon transcriptional repressor/proline dehydrogenase/delta 1-pyrroline-5-carboxylate dehydrogenase
MPITLVPDMADASLTDRSIEQVRAWVAATSAEPSPLTELVRDPAGLDFTVQFIDRVIRPEDPETAAGQLRVLVRRMPAFLTGRQRLLLRVGALVGRRAPQLVQRRATQTIRRLVGDLVLDSRPKQLTTAITAAVKNGDQLNLSLLGEAVLGEAEADRHLQRVLDLIRRDDVHHVSVKVTSIFSQLQPWAFDATVAEIAARLESIYFEAERTATFVNLDMEDYASFDLTVAAFMRALDEFPNVSAGIAVQAYLPDSLDALQRLQEWAATRCANGGVPIRVRLVKGANLSLERVDATLRGWPLATWPTKVDTDANFKRLLHWALTPERVENVTIAVAGQNLFDLAYARLLADERDVRSSVEFEALAGFDGGPLRLARRELGSLRLYTPVADPAEFDVAIAYLVRRLQEASARGNFLAAVPDLNSPAVFEREAAKFRASADALSDADLAGTSEPVGARTQDRNDALPPRPDAFVNTPDTDPALRANREWAVSVAYRSTYTQMGAQDVALSRLLGPFGLDALVETIRDGARDWCELSIEVRAWAIHQAGVGIESRRGDLIAVMMAETGKTFAEADTEVSEAADFAHYYADASLRLAAVDGARFAPARLTVVASPWNFPVAIPAGSVLAALAAGSGVILKPAPEAPRSAAVLADILWEAGIPRDLLALAALDDGGIGQALISHSGADRVVLTGSWETAELFRSWRPDLRLMAETSGKNAIVVTPSADRDRAVADLVRSAFGNAGQKCSAASLAILVGSVGESERFKRQLADAAASLVVGLPDDLRATVGPLVAPATGKLLDALTNLAAGESWLVEPRQLDEDGRLWSPGIKIGVQPGSSFHTTECFGPVLGLMHAATLDEAITWQNGTDYGLTAGLHSLDAAEVNTWLAGVEAGNLYVNRPITGAIVQRQPFGGWKRSSVGVTAKAGGPNYLAQFGRWHPQPFRRPPAAQTLTRPVTELIDRFAPLLDAGAVAQLKASAASDELAWDREFGRIKDVSGLAVERNVLRYLPATVAVRVESSLADAARVLVAATRAGASVTVSAGLELPTGVPHVIETNEAWLDRMGSERPSRIRLVGGSAKATSEAVDGDPGVAIHADPVTGSGRVELLPFLREQSISITAHRYGLHDRGFDPVLPRK